MAIRIDVETLADRLAAGGYLIDVRERNEYEAGHVPGARLVALSALPGSAPGLDLPRDRVINVICQSGNRSQKAADLLAGLGFQAESVDGGTQGWIASGRAVTSGPDQS